MTDDVVSAGPTGAGGDSADDRGAPLVEEGPLGTRLETSSPFLRVVKGDPTPEQLAALVTVLAALGSPPTARPRRTPSWNAPRRLHQVTHTPGPGGWRASGLPL